ncbi:hypothetical protein EIP86_007627 [Pleurotus ostreatoroseus]|nr:hypothetical protein EIP86_007627 [Pleurotus ostreatoroseus]
MATPSSSTTTPSPRPMYLQAAVVVPPSASVSKQDPNDDKEERQQAIQKFLASAELSQVGWRRFPHERGPQPATRPLMRPCTSARPIRSALVLAFPPRGPLFFCDFHVYIDRVLTVPLFPRRQLARGLRTRLAYASFKAANNLTRNTLPDLEAQALSHATSAKVLSAKVPSNHYNNPATQGNGAVGTATPSRTPRKGAMAPPSVTASATQSLYASLLQPPPSKRARTIHNPQDPPLTPSQKARPSTPSRKTGKGSRAAHSAQAKTKGRKEDKGKRKASPRHATSSRHRVTPQSTLDSEGFADEDVDMKAAATLTSLLHSHPSKSATASSPRSSLSAGSDGGSMYSVQFVQSSTRSTAPTSQAPSGEPSFTLPASFPRASTPQRGHMRTQSLPHQGSLHFSGSTTPKGQMSTATRLQGTTTPVPPSDTEAADLMLFLATSPSPVRPASKEPAALRSLTGSGGLKGRVLFGQSQGGEDKSPRPLRREASGSFTSVTTEPGSDAGGAGSQDRITGAPATSSLLNPNHNRAGGSMQDVTLVQAAPPVPIAVTAQPAPAERVVHRLLPAPTSPTPAPRQRAEVFERPRSLPAPGDMKFAAPPTPNSAFNIAEYINVSPSPAAPGPAKQTTLRADVGRRLFEEHHAMPGGDVQGGVVAVPGSSLGAGIDLVKSQV